MKKVNIPSPCHEDWNEMTPTLKGAFCSSCKIDVIDFTNKSNREIQNILLENRGKKLCGHIKSSQIKALNQHYSDWENQSHAVFQSKFLWACIMVFGLFLFSGCDTIIEPQPQLLGELEYVELDSAKKNCPTIEEKTVDQPIKKACVQPVEINDSDFDIIDGDMIIEEDFYDSLEIWETEIDAFDIKN